MKETIDLIDLGRMIPTHLGYLETQHMASLPQ